MSHYKKERDNNIIMQFLLGVGVIMSATRAVIVTAFIMLIVHPCQGFPQALHGTFKIIAS